MTLTTGPPNRLLDLQPGTGQRSATFTFHLFDGTSGDELGELHPGRDQVPTLSHDTSRTIKRTLSPLVLPPSEATEINTVRERVRVSMLLAGVSWPLGRYMFTDNVRLRSTGGTWSTSTLLDEMFLVDQKISTGFAPLITPGTAQTGTSVENVGASLERLLAELPVTLHADQTPFSSATSWPSGTNRGRILDELALVGDYFPPWFSNEGVLRFIRSFDPADQVPQFDWDTNDVTIRDSIAETDDLLVAANRIVVVSNATSNAAAAQVPIVGTFDIPTSAPHSIFNRGFVIPDVRTVPCDDPGQAAAIAANIGQRRNIFERVELSTAPDPRHDSYDVVRWNDENWLELSWSLPLIEGGEMRHVMRKAYT